MIPSRTLLDGAGEGAVGNVGRRGHGPIGGGISGNPQAAKPASMLPEIPPPRCASGEAPQGKSFWTVPETSFSLPKGGTP
jgi:hypothetical protein